MSYAASSSLYPITLGLLRCVALRFVVQNSAVNWRSVHNVWCVPDGLMRFLDCCVAELTRLACCCVVLAAIGEVVLQRERAV